MLTTILRLTEEQESEDNEMSREMWKAVETKTRKIGVVKTKRRRRNRRDREEVRKKRRKKERKEKI